MQIDQLPSYVVTVAATNHAELLDKAVWRRFQLRLLLPAPTVDLLGEFVGRHIRLWPEKVKTDNKQIAAKLFPTSFAEALDFVQTVRRQHILAMSSRSLDIILTEQLNLWKSRLLPEERHDLRPKKAAPSTKRTKASRPKTR